MNPLTIWFDVIDVMYRYTVDTLHMIYLCLTSHVGTELHSEFHPVSESGTAGQYDGQLELKDKFIRLGNIETVGNWHPYN
jgi:hypothetical protein